MTANVTIDGFDLPLESPATQGDYAARVRDLAVAGTAIYPVGGATALEFGTPPARPGVALALTHLNRIVDYPVQDLTITVEAGMTVATLQRTLAAEGQRVPVDVPDAERATLGGALAVDAHGPRRLGYGRFRDWVIGMTTINDRGELCKSGGRVVKNVAGYDLAKLMIGSSGGLGVISQVTLKLQPRPAATALVAFPIVDIAATLDALHASQTRPVAVELLNDEAARIVGELPAGWVGLVLFEDNPEAVRWQVEQLAKELARAVTEVPLTMLDSLIASPAVAGCELSILAGMKPSQVADFVRPLHGVRVHAHALSGIVRVGVPTMDHPAFESLGRELLSDPARHAIVRRCPTTWKNRLNMWGPPSPAATLVRRVKEQLDPKGVLNPGRTSYG